MKTTKKSSAASSKLLKSVKQVKKSSGTTLAQKRTRLGREIESGLRDVLANLKSKKPVSKNINRT